jgi:hypothetical protein
MAQAVVEPNTAATSSAKKEKRFLRDVLTENG